MKAITILLVLCLSFSYANSQHRMFLDVKSKRSHYNTKYTKVAAAKDGGMVVACIDRTGGKKNALGIYEFDINGDYVRGHKILLREGQENPKDAIVHSISQLPSKRYIVTGNEFIIILDENLKIIFDKITFYNKDFMDATELENGDIAITYHEVYWVKGGAYGFGRDEKNRSGIMMIFDTGDPNGLWYRWKVVDDQNDNIYTNFSAAAGGQSLVEVNHLLWKDGTHHTYINRYNYKNSTKDSISLENVWETWIDKTTPKFHDIAADKVGNIIYLVLGHDDILYFGKFDKNVDGNIWQKEIGDKPNEIVPWTKNTEKERFFILPYKDKIILVAKGKMSQNTYINKKYPGQHHQPFINVYSNDGELLCSNFIKNNAYQPQPDSDGSIFGKPIQYVAINEEQGFIHITMSDSQGPDFTITVKFELEEGTNRSTYLANEDVGDIKEENYNNTASHETKKEASKPTEFTITNKTGSSINLIDDGGNSEGYLNDGNSKTFDCDEIIYQAIQNSGGTWNIKGDLIANGENSCGKTIIYK